ncbi:TonB-dependent receptor protein [Acetobacter malorum DSM 14337]|uniref:TonB-dependent receptor protein n=1 Tax=Acetobacter malorum DSM 14337 TaxID=1307910 RepID=A0ABQ0PWI7_9PROT|nr:TonB-dependent receptor [Acetobacter malorum]GBQ83399.1 TonB-dependent receptor protein [Acetobacter malorum DSM 14337]
MSHTDRRKKRLPLSFSLLYALPVFAAGVPVLAQAATATSATESTTTNTTAKKVTAKKVAGTPATTSSAKTIQQARGTAAGGTETVEVTGSYLRQGRNTSPNPVQIITSREIQQTGVTNVGDFLQRMPSIGSSGLGNADTNGGDGVGCTDLRNLGSSRVLVLVDGKRLTQTGMSGSSCVDMNTIPVMAIQSVEILKDGGSELYGADAVAGVINIKMRHDLNTGGINVRGDITQRGDNRTGLISGYKGFNFDHDRGNITLMGQYDTVGGVMMKDRAWSRIAQTSNGMNPNFGSVISTSGTVFSPDGVPLYNGNSAGGSSPYSKSSRYNYNKDTSLLNNTQNASLMGDAHYDFSKHFTLYSNVMYSHKTSWTQMAPIPAMGSVAPSDLPNTIYLPTGYPGNTAGDIYNDPSDPAYMYRRISEFGPRKSESAVDSLTAKVGASGEIIAGWMYDASFTFGSTMSSFQTSGVGDYNKLMREWGLDAVTPGDSNSLLAYNPNSCVGYAGCVQSSALGPLSTQAAQYANYTEHDHSQYTMRDFNARIHNDHVVHMPYKGGGDLGIALGMEHRGEQMSYHPDPLIAQGGSLTNTVLPTGGGFNVSEAYLEGNLTLLHNVPFAKNLSIDGQGRFSSYNTFGTTYNWKAGINWAPTRDVAFRGTLGTSFRQPSVSELYGGTLMSYNGANDPCDMTQISSYGGRQATVMANCMKQGINPANFQQGGSGQVATLNGGNAKLQPEIGRTYTFGATFTPHWIPGLSTSASFWHYNVSHTIGALSTQYVLDGCYTGSDPSMCGNIARSSSGQINTVSALNANLGSMTTSGVDWDLSYRFRVTDADWFMVENNFQRLVSFKQQMVPNGPRYNYLGSITYQQGGTSNPTVRDYATLTWHHNNFSVTYMMQYISGMHWNDGTNTIYKSQGYGRDKTPAMVLQDLTFNYNLKRWNFQFEIQNLADKQPPFLVNTSSNSNDSTYGGWYAGRSFLLQAGVNF